MKKTLIILLLSCSAPTIIMAQVKKTGVKSSGTQATAATRGKTVYNTFCLSCHQADGSGVPNLNPPLYNTEWVNGNKNSLIQIVLNGSKGQVEIDGETFHNTMPAQNHLTDQQIADVLTYIRSNFGNKSTAVTIAEVKTARAKTKKS